MEESDLAKTAPELYNEREGWFEQRKVDDEMHEAYMKSNKLSELEIQVNSIIIYCFQNEGATVWRFPSGVAHVYSD